MIVSCHVGGEGGPITVDPSFRSQILNHPKKQKEEIQVSLERATESHRPRSVVEIPGLVF